MAANNNILGVRPFEIVVNNMEHVLTLNLPVLDPRPPLTSGEFPNDICKPLGKVHQPLNLASAYCAAPDADRKLQGMLTYLVGSETGGLSDSVHLKTVSGRSWREAINI